MKEKQIVYTGIGAKKTRMHTEREFLHIMNKTFKKSCATELRGNKCKSCKKSKEFLHKMIKSHKPANTNAITRKYNQYSAKCQRCKRNTTKKCSLKEYIKFSGAELK